ncbi:MAG: type IV pilus modification protein PilV [Gammaproteobacteria bacterium]|nr:type IV pilus modification protein PilV [Gammaproteobacteria bacterium]
MSVTRCAAARGFTLLEVMIAVVVFSIGLLGIAGLQVAGMRFTHDAHLRSIATAQAENMADRMRTNAAGMAAGNYDVSGAMPTSYPKDCDARQCTPAELATFDLVSWNTAVANKAVESNAGLLPGGDGVVCLDSTPDDGDTGNWQCDDKGSVYAVKLRWVERTSGANDTGQKTTGTTTLSADTERQRLVLRVLP